MVKDANYLLTPPQRRAIVSAHQRNNETAAMTDQQREAKQEAISDLADKYLDEAMRQGDAFSEGLCNWAINKAEQELGSVQ